MDLKPIGLRRHPYKVSVSWFDSSQVHLKGGIMSLGYWITNAFLIVGFILGLKGASKGNNGMWVLGILIMLSVILVRFMFGIR